MSFQRCRTIVRKALSSYVAIGGVTLTAPIHCEAASGLQLYRSVYKRSRARLGCFIHLLEGRK
eukprot:scaffold1594_cov401-Prasinococcus_capsulatus_cf.AAC.32